MNVTFSDYSKAKLKEIYLYYKAIGKGGFGRKIRANILKKALLLRSLPEIGQEEETLKKLKLGHRYLVEGNYKIIYRIIGEKILVTDIFDTRQNPNKM